MKTIRVTAENIANGKRSSYCDCPVARGMFESTGEVWFVTNATVTRAVGSLVVALPDVARKFIEDFDAGRPVQPIEFTLPLAGDE